MLKLLLNIYQPSEGAIRLGDINLANINNRLWRSKCGVVMQGGYIFYDSISGDTGVFLYDTTTLYVSLWIRMDGEVRHVTMGLTYSYVGSKCMLGRLH